MVSVSWSYTGMPLLSIIWSGIVPPMITRVRPILLSVALAAFLRPRSTTGTISHGGSRLWVDSLGLGRRVRHPRVG